MLQGKILGHLGALFTVSAWGSSFIFTKVLMEDASLSPIEVYVYRFVVAYVVLLPFTIRNIFAKNIRDELQLMMCGLCAGSIFFILENYALQYTTTGNVSLLSSLSPIITTALMALIFRFKPGVGMIVGSLIAFLGVGCVILSHAESIEFNPLGDFLALTTAFSWAVYAVGIKRLVPLYSSFFITRKLFFYGVLSALPLLWISNEPLHVNILFSNTTYILNLLFLSVACSLLAYIIWNYATASLGPVTTNNYIYFQPLVTLIVAYFVFDEIITPLGYLGCVLVIGGLIVSDKLKVKRRLHHVRK